MAEMEKKKEYESMTIEVVKFETEDVIQASGSKGESSTSNLLVR